MTTRIDWDSFAPGVTPEASPGLGLWRVTNLWQRRIRAALRPHDLTHVQFVLLTTLSWVESREEGIVTQTALAQRAATDPMMTSEVVRELAKKGLVTRARHPEDGRAVAVSLTADGAARVVAALPDVMAVDKGFFGALSASAPAFTAALDHLAKTHGEGG